MDGRHTTVRVQHCLDRLEHGEAGARDELLSLACERLTRLTRKILNEFPDVRRWEQTDDVFQNAVLRLCRALESVDLTDARHFFNLAATLVRRELLDLARHYRGPGNVVRQQVSQLSGAGSSESKMGCAMDVADTTNDPDQLAEWAEFHRQIERLPAREKEVFNLLWYHGLNQQEAANLLNVDVRTVKRRWRAARISLHAACTATEGSDSKARSCDGR